MMLLLVLIISLLKLEIIRKHRDKISPKSQDTEICKVRNNSNRRQKTHDLEQMQRYSRISTYISYTFAKIYHIHTYIKFQIYLTFHILSKSTFLLCLLNFSHNRFNLVRTYLVKLVKGFFKFCIEKFIQT